MKQLRTYLTKTLVTLSFILCILPSFSSVAMAQSSLPNTTYFAITPCGQSGFGGPYKPAIDLGCSGKGNPILDAMFGIIKFLSDGVGIVITGSMILAGIQYILSSGDPQANAAAVKRIRSNVSALLLFIFSYVILNYLIPGAVLK